MTGKGTQRFLDDLGLMDEGPLAVLNIVAVDLQPGVGFAKQILLVEVRSGEPKAGEKNHDSAEPVSVSEKVEGAQTNTEKSCSLSLRDDGIGRLSVDLLRGNDDVTNSPRRVIRIPGVTSVCVCVCVNLRPHQAAAIIRAGQERRSST